MRLFVATARCLWTISGTTGEWPNIHEDFFDVLVPRPVLTACVFVILCRTCNSYCASIGRLCTGAWEESGDSCVVKYEMTCNQTVDSSDALCECGQADLQGICIHCPAGSYCSGGGLITPCPGSSTSIAGSSQIADCKCDPGHTGPDGGECSPCAIGTFKPASGPQACTQCPTNSLSPEGSTRLVSCKCNPGHTGPDGATCSACAIGTFKPGSGSQACTQCPTNSSSPRASIQLTDCTCIAGYTGPDGGACSPCARGEYKDVTGSSECVSCSANSDAPAGSDAISDCQCVAGYTGPDGGACTACSAGKFKPTSGSSLCWVQPPCPIGYTGPESGPCEPCVAGKFKDVNGSEPCMQCPVQSTSSQGSTQQTDCFCNKGYTGPLGGSCVACSPGTFKPTLGSASCSECPFDSSSPKASNASVDCSCNAGYFSDAPGGHCKICEAESYCTGGTAISPCGLVITPIEVVTFEEDGSAPATFAISLSGPPAGSMTAKISTHPQLSCSPGQVDFTPNEYGPVTISCYAVVDDVLEGRQVANLVISLEPNAEIESYGPQLPANVEIQIEELSCPSLADDNNYLVFDCDRLLGGNCYLQCRPGFDPQSVEVQQCIKDSSTGRAVWTGKTPTCQDCLSGHYKQGLDCMPCSQKSCQTGQYLSCAAEIGSICLECTNKIPDHAYYSSAGEPSDGNSCKWSCQPGYINYQGFSCLQDIGDDDVLVIKTKSPTISEEPGSLPAIFSISLSIPPVSTIVCRLTYSSSQLNPPSQDELVFTPDSWAAQQNVTIGAINDGLDEGTHSGWFSVRIIDSAATDSELMQRSSQSSLERLRRTHMSRDQEQFWLALSHTPNHVDLPIDPRFVGKEQNISVIIMDYGCPALQLPQNGNFSCTETAEAKRCTVVCDPGYSLDYTSYYPNGSISSVVTNTSENCQVCAAMECDKSTLTWNKVVPQCTQCSSGYFRRSGSCLACSTKPCPVGKYRGECMPDRDSVCMSCTASKPAHSHFTAGGIPSSLDNCSWACDEGYYQMGASDITAAQTCEKISSPTPQPFDSDGDGIPDEIEGDDRTDTDHDGTPDYLDTDRFCVPTVTRNRKSTGFHLLTLGFHLLYSIAVQP